MIEAESSLALTFKSDLFIGSEPTSPQNVVTLYDTPGFSPDGTLTKGEEIWRPALQVKVRNASYEAAGDLINLIKEVLHNRAGEVWNGTNYMLIQCDQEPFPLGFTENNLSQWVCNFSIQRQ